MSSTPKIKYSVNTKIGGHFYSYDFIGVLAEARRGFYRFTKEDGKELMVPISRTLVVSEIVKEEPAKDE